MGRVVKESYIEVMERAEPTGELFWYDGETAVEFSIFGDSLLFDHTTLDLKLEGEVVFKSTVNDKFWKFSRKKVGGKYECLLKQLAEEPDDYLTI